MKNLICLGVIIFAFFNASFSLAAPPPPQLCFSTTGVSLSVDWTTVEGATGYTLYYAPYPYTGEASIGSLDRGIETEFHINLWNGAAYYIAVTSRDGTGESGYSNILQFTTFSDGNSSSVTSCVDAGGSRSDDDGDGFTEDQGDCDDTDSSLHPGADEICGDTIDQDCNGMIDDPCSPVYLHGKVGSYPTIQNGIDSAVDGDIVVARDGTYYENLDFDGAKITVKSENGASFTTVDGNNADRVVTFNSGEDETSVLEGFTITNGTSSGWGAGVYIQNASPIIRDCVITENSTKIGAGLYIISSSPTITGCTISLNTASNIGGGIWSRLSTVTIDNCIIENNSSDNSGGGAYFDSSDVTINGTDITQNNSGSTGGGIYCNRSSTVITDSSLSGNTPQDSFGCD